MSITEAKRAISDLYAVFGVDAILQSQTDIHRVVFVSPNDPQRIVVIESVDSLNDMLRYNSLETI